MAERKQALGIAKRYRMCPPLYIIRHPENLKKYQRHLKICPYCNEAISELDNWKNMLNIVTESGEQKSGGIEKPIEPAQLRLLTPSRRSWHSGFYYNPPMVLILKKNLPKANEYFVAQTYHDPVLAGPGDLVLNENRSDLPDIFIETWNIYTVNIGQFGRFVGCVMPDVISAVLNMKKVGNVYPDWAYLPRPLVENDPRIYFRKMEFEVAYRYANQTVFEMKHDILRENEKNLLREQLRLQFPDIHWHKGFENIHEAFLFARFPEEHYAMAGNADKTDTFIWANLIKTINGEILTIEPIPAEIRAEKTFSGHKSLYGQFLQMPEAHQFQSSQLIAIYTAEEKKYKPAVQNFDAAEGRFFLEFVTDTEIKGKLHIAIICEIPDPL